MRKPRQAGPGAPSCPCGSPKRCRELAAAVDPPRLELDLAIHKIIIENTH